MPYAIINPNTEQARYDYLTMQTEWRDFLEAQCGCDKADPALVAALTQRHACLFREALYELEILWSDLDGRLGVPPHVVAVHGDETPITREELEEMWSNAFDYVNESFEEIEAGVDEERSRGVL